MGSHGHGADGEDVYEDDFEDGDEGGPEPEPAPQPARPEAERSLLSGLQGKIHRVDPKFACQPGSLTENPYKSLRVDPNYGSTL